MLRRRWTTSLEGCEEGEGGKGEPKPLVLSHLGGRGGEESVVLFPQEEAMKDGMWGAGEEEEEGGEKRTEMCKPPLVF